MQCQGDEMQGVWRQHEYTTSGNDLAVNGSYYEDKSEHTQMDNAAMLDAEKSRIENNWRTKQNFYYIIKIKNQQKLKT